LKREVRRKFYKPVLFNLLENPNKLCYIDNSKIQVSHNVLIRIVSDSGRI